MTLVTHERGTQARHRDSGIIFHPGPLNMMPQIEETACPDLVKLPDNKPCIVTFPAPQGERVRPPELMERGGGQGGGVRRHVKIVLLKNFQSKVSLNRLWGLGV